MTRKILNRIIIGVLVILIIIGGGYILLTKQAPKIVIFSPQDGSTNIDLSTTLNFTFDRAISDGDLTNFSINIDPAISYKKSKLEKGIIVSFDNDLKTGTKYSVDVFYLNSKLISFSFETTPFTKEDLQILKNSQNTTLPGDYEFSQVINQMYTKFPWLSKLPIETSYYRIVYDYDKNSFRIRILVPISSDSQKQSLVNQALTDLRNIGVTGNPIPYYVLTQ